MEHQGNSAQARRYRLRTLLGGKVWPWRARRSEAVADALAAGLAERDEYKQLWWDPFVRVEEMEAANDAPAAPPGPP